MKQGEEGATLEWLAGLNLADFRGQWIVAHGRKILAKAPTLEQALEQASLAPDAVPLVWRVPQEEKLIL